MLPSPNPQVIFKPLASGAVIYSPTDEVYFGLNPVGVRIWQLLPPASETVDDICRVLSAEYSDVTPDVLRADVIELLGELTQLGLLLAPGASAMNA